MSEMVTPAMPAEASASRHNQAALSAPPLPASASVRVVIVNYRTPGLTLDCLESLAGEVADRPEIRVVVVEGGSGDDSADRLREGIAQRGYGGWVTLDVRESNAGFAGGNNAAIVPAMAEVPPPAYVWLLNPDTVVRAGASMRCCGLWKPIPTPGWRGAVWRTPTGRRRPRPFASPPWPTLSRARCGSARFHG